MREWIKRNVVFVHRLPYGTYVYLHVVPGWTVQLSTVYGIRAWRKPAVLQRYTD